MLNSGEPFGLPAGTVRGLIAMAVTAATLYLFVTGQDVPEALLALNGLVVGSYYSARGVASTIRAMQPPEEPPLAPPATGEDAT